MKFRKRTITWVIIVYCSIIIILSIISINNGTKALNKQKVAGLRSDYLLHVLLFIPWMVLARWRWKKIDKKGILWILLAIGLLFAGFSETVQTFVPNRSFNLIDLAANCLGILVGALISGREGSTGGAANE